VVSGLHLLDRSCAVVFHFATPHGLPFRRDVCSVHFDDPLDVHSLYPRLLYPCCVFRESLIDLYGQLVLQQCLKQLVLRLVRLQRRRQF
jgi:hypothetical protein